MRLQDIMNTKVETILATEPADRAWERMRNRGIHHLVIIHGGKPVGVVSAQDLGGARGAQSRQGKIVAHFMSPNMISAGPRATVRQAANLLRGYGVGCLPVMDDGKLVGIVTVSDLLDLIGRGAERPSPETKRWTLKHRGARPKRRGLVVRRP